ncbi:MAG: radical SAM protein, partial [Bacteroidota bacterium]
MCKPRGAICNLDCAYCYYLEKEDLYPGATFRMSDEVLEAYVRQYIASQFVPEVTFAWQGGEPTLMGLDFFERAVFFQQKYARPGMRVVNSLQTNGTTLDDAWCRFFRDHDFLVGISIDGPKALHDAYRVDKGGAPTFDRVMRGLRLLRKHGVRYNVLTTVHAANADHPAHI